MIQSQIALTIPTTHRPIPPPEKYYYFYYYGNTL
jgi:hypothetical protein